MRYDYNTTMHKTRDRNTVHKTWYLNVLKL